MLHTIHIKVCLLKNFLHYDEQWVDREDRLAVEINGELIGMVSYYWEHEPSKWLEMGIVLYDPKSWGKGYGFTILKSWINYLFDHLPIVRVGFATWSGNKRLIRLGEKLGMKMEERIRRVRYWQGEYYDSIRMGLLREEWENNPSLKE